MTNPADGIKDAMWHFLRTGGQRASVESMEDIAHDIIKCLTQKTGGQAKYAKAGDIDIRDFDMLVTMAAMEMVALVLDTRWPEVKKILKEKRG